MAPRVKVYLECGARRTFASALDWPGWCRQGPDETAALDALLAFGPRYASILARTRVGFVAPENPGQLVVVERLPGTATTDFGAPGVAPAVDRDRSCSAAERARFEKILSAVGWKAAVAGRSSDRLTATRAAILAALKASTTGEIPTRGPRGGIRWTGRYFVRRVAWHVIAHVWEIERRTARETSR